MPRKRKQVPSDQQPTVYDKESSKSKKRKIKEENFQPEPKVKGQKLKTIDANTQAIKTESKANECKAVAGEGQIKQEIVDKDRMFVGAHVSAAGGVHNAVTNAVDIGCKAFALFLKSQRQWNAKPLDPDVIKKFKDAIQAHGFEPHLILPHGSYLINCGSPDTEVLAKSKHGLIEELKRAEQLGLTRYNFHPGSTCGKQSVEKSISQIAACINEAHEKTEQIVTVIENMSRQGNTIGGKFEELGSIIEQVTDKSRIGVCLDTCHAFAAGFDLTTEEGYTDMMHKFDQLVGFDYLKAMHINDSKGDLGCHLDRHELIGKGKIGKKPFERIMNDKRLENIPLILETPDETAWQREIKLLYSMGSA